MKNFKGVLFIIALIIIISAVTVSIINWYNTAEFAWTYLKYNNNLYVLNSPVRNLELLNGGKLVKVGKVEKEIPIFFKPKSNNVSNGLPKGTEIYTSDRISDTYEVVIKFKNKFYTLVNTANADGWGNGIMVRLH